MPEHGTPERERLIRTASLIALIGNGILAAAKLATGLLAGSLAVLGDGIDSSTDVAIAVMGLAVASVISKPADAKHPWGHSRAETMATAVLSFILFFAGAQLIFSSASEILSPARAAIPEPAALAVTGVSIAGKLALALILRRYGKKAGSNMLSANAANMAGDVLISAGVLAGLLVSVLLDFPLADPIAALLVGAWVIKNSIGIFKETNLELMDGTAERGAYKTVFDAVRSVDGVDRPHRTRMRRIANKWDIDLDIEVDGSMSLSRAHALAHRAEEAIKAALPDVYDIMVHVEPAGSMAQGHSEEAYGLSETDLGGKDD